jgi:DNA-directed RNA polymerase subunit beta'
MKDMGYKFAFKGGLSFSLETLEFQIKTTINRRCQTQVEGISVNYNMGLITITNVTTKLLMYGHLPCQLTELAMKTLEKTNKVSTQCT